MKKLRIVAILFVLSLSLGMLTITLAVAGSTANDDSHHASLVKGVNKQTDIKKLQSPKVKDVAMTNLFPARIGFMPGTILCSSGSCAFDAGTHSDNCSEAGSFYAEEFETSNGGYTHGGTADEWEWGTPTTSPPDGAQSGANVWGTDLDGDYDPNSSQVLTSTLIDLSAIPAGTELILNWWQSWYIESVDFDTSFVEVSIGGGPWTQVWAHSDPPINVPWTQIAADVSGAASTTLRVRWRLETDGFGQLAGLYVDDVTVRGGCVNLDDSTKTGPPSVNYAEVITYSIMLTNSGDIDAVEAILSDTIPTRTTYVPGSLSCGTGVCSYDVGDNKINWSGVISQSLPQPVFISFAVRPGPSACFGETISNTAWVDHDSIGNGPVEVGPTTTICQGGPSIILTKTVGTDPDTCAVTDSITITPGTFVTYCYEVTNTGTVPLMTHDLDDNQLGAILSNFAFDLGPGETTYVTATTTITQTTVNTATWMASDAFAGTAGDSDFASVTTMAQWTVYIPIIIKSTTVESAVMRSD